MFQFTNLNFDFNGDGIADSHAEFIDSDGDGIYDTALFDFNHDGIMDTTGVDSNHDGIIDTYHTELDTSHDGYIDTVIDGHDYDQNGMIESQTTYHDSNHDGLFEEVIKAYDSDHDGQIDTITTYQDLDGDGNENTIIKERYIDQDGDGQIDTYMINTDSDGDHVFEAVEVYRIDAGTGTIELNPVTGEAVGTVSGVCVDDLRNFDPMKANMNLVSGDPVHAMGEWEFQGNTGRCALYVQKFVVEELTHREIDIGELAQLAERNGWFSEESGTPLLNMDKVLDYYGLPSNMSFHNDIMDIQKCLESGGKVIVSIDADEIWYGENDDLFTPGDGPNHAVEVIGIDRTNPEEFKK